jgi:predicted CopG family antitoxin
MRTKTIRLDEDVYERLRENKRDDETFSEAVERLMGSRSLAELGDVLDDERRVESMEAAIEDANEADTREVDELLDEFE